MLCLKNFKNYNNNVFSKFYTTNIIKLLLCYTYGMKLKRLGLKNYRNCEDICLEFSISNLYNQAVYNLPVVAAFFCE